MQENLTRTPTAMVILPCPICGRSVKVLGRVRRVLCACGEILMEVGHETSSSVASSVPTELKAG
ncbi:MAG: hypothetical protein ACRD3V_31485 [Vicinamibacteria bacterium]